MLGITLQETQVVLGMLNGKSIQEQRPASIIRLKNYPL